MGRSKRGFYTMVGWAAVKGAKWYVAKRLGLHRPRRRLRTVGLVLAGTVVAGGATAFVLSQSSHDSA